MLLAYLWQDPLMFLTMILAFLLSLTIHEFAHGLVAKLEGDETAEQLGRLTLNPLAHLDPLGSLMFLLIGFGWAKPVPIDYSRLKHRRFGPAIVSLAGPAANLVGAIVFAVILVWLLPYLGTKNLLLAFLESLFVVNAMLMLFNLIPIPPLDGSHVFLAVVPDRYWTFKAWWLKNGPWMLIMLVLADSLLNLGLFNAIFQTFWRLLARFL
ncbi:MAG: site-2 protease family protein [Candidatus Buchananbacteria bacterium]